MGIENVSIACSKYLPKNIQELASVIPKII